MIYTIGYSNRPLEEFAEQLGSRCISGIIDVRSSPRSRNPSFNGSRLAQWCVGKGINYAHEGHVLGGRSQTDPRSSCYNAAIQRLICASRRSNVAILCAEGEPEKCHRCYDIGATLILRYDIEATNIRRDNSDEKMSVSLRLVPAGLYNPLIVAPGTRW